MRKFAIAAVAVLAIAGSTAVYAQHHRWGLGFSRMNPEDRSAYADARIAAVHAGLKLTAEQEKLWPPVEAAVRDFAKLRIDRAKARQKPLKSSGFLPFGRPVKARENLPRLAGHPGVALLNDGLSRRPFRTHASGRIAQLVEQLTLNQRVPGSSPGAPTIAKTFYFNKL